MKISLIKSKDGSLIPYSAEERESFNKFEDGAIYEVDIKNMDIRTIQQNKALHLFCKHISETLNEKGLYVQDVLKMETVWTMQTVKETVFKPVVKQLYGKDSTTKLKKNEFNNIIDSIILAFSKKGIVIQDFPSRDRS